MAKKPTYEELEQRVRELEKEAIERKRAEEALRESEERYKGMFNYTKNGVAIYKAMNDGEDFIFVDFNKSGEKIENVKKDELTGKRVTEMFPGVRDFGLFEVFQRVWATEKPEHHPVTMYKDERISGWRDNFVYKLPSGEIVAVYSDETERKLSEEALRQSEERYRGLVEGSIQGILILQDSIIQFANKAAARIFGYLEPEQLIGLNMGEVLLAPQEMTELQRRASDILSGKSVTVHHGWQGVRKDGERIWIQSSASLISWKSKPAILSFLIDVTEREQAEQALRESEERYRTLFEESRDAVYINTVDGKLIATNQALCDLFGYSREEMIGFDGRKLYADPADRLKFQKEIEKKGFVKDYEVKLRGKDGREIDGLLNVNIRRASDGSILGYQGIVTNITEKKKLQAQLLQAQKMEAMGTLAGGIAHDFNNLLMGIQGNASLVLSGIDSRSPHWERLKNIEQGVRSGAELTKQLLGFARGGKYEVKPTDLNELIRRSSDMFARTKKEITIHRRYEEDIWTAEVDQGQIEQVLLNLYVNAWQAMPSGGELYLETENVTLKRRYVKAFDLKSGRYVKISIADTGVGMDEATQQRIFEPFFTTKEMGRGTGLGLASVYGIIKSHDGIINIDSKRGEGSTFTIYLPASEKEVIKDKELPEEVLKGEETVLLIDDEDMIIDVGEEVLGALGYKALTARGGKEAIELYRENKDKIDMVILDMVMPEMGGGETYDRLKEINPHIKVLLSSGYSIEGQATEILERGCDGFIQKPFNMKQLSRSIREILDRE